MPRKTGTIEITIRIPASETAHAMLAQLAKDLTDACVYAKASGRQDLADCFRLVRDAIYMRKVVRS